MNNNNNNNDILVKPKVLVGRDAFKIGQFITSIRVDAKKNGTTTVIEMWKEENYELVKELIVMGYTEIKPEDVDKMNFNNLSTFVFALTNAKSEGEKNFTLTVNKSKKVK